MESGAWVIREVSQGSNREAGPPPPPPRQHPGDRGNLLHLLRVRANLWKSGISCVLALSPLGHMLLNDSCLTASARGTQSFQPKFDKHTFLLSVLLWAICQGGMVPSPDRQDAEIGPPRKVQRQCRHQRELGEGGSLLSIQETRAWAAGLKQEPGPHSKLSHQIRCPMAAVGCYKAVLLEHSEACKFLGTLHK